MDKSSNYQAFRNLSNDKLFYFHMAIVPVVVTELKPLGSGSFYAFWIISLTIAMIYAFIKVLNCNKQISELQKELDKKGVFFNIKEQSKPMSFKEYVKAFPKMYAPFAQSVIGVALFSYYLYITEAIPPTLFENLSGWFYYISFTLLAMLIVFTLPMISHMNPSPKRYKLAKAFNIGSPIFFFVFLVGTFPFVAIVLYIIIRVMMNHDMTLTQSFFPSDYHLYFLLYASFMNAYIFERLHFKYQFRNSENKGEQDEEK